MAKSKSSSTSGKITVRLSKGLMATNQIQRATVRGLGLRRRDDTRTLENSPAVRGMIKKVMHLLTIVEEQR